MSTAYGILSDADKRARYDKEGFGGLEKKDLEVPRKTILISCLS